MSASPHHGPLDSFISYIGGSSLIAFSFADMATFAQQLGAIFGCIVIGIKLWYDVRKILRDRKKKKENKE